MEMMVWLQIRSVGTPYDFYVKAFVLLAANKLALVHDPRRFMNNGLTLRPQYRLVNAAKATSEAGTLSLASKGRTIQ
eukprot:scaffold11129_cov56-Skeletonema_dohrnii-CCMP3373.AAC.1